MLRVKQVQETDRETDIENKPEKEMLLKDKLVNGFLTFVLRGLFGILSIYVINYVYMRCGLSSHVAINEVNACVCGVLGLPGVGLLYGISYLFGV